MSTRESERERARRFQFPHRFEHFADAAIALAAAMTAASAMTPRARFGRLVATVSIRYYAGRANSRSIITRQ
jgi:hypothetical protein